jgi:glycosyltransferase involved in cell wall biosynthesis
MSVKRFGIFVAYSPGVSLHTEGLGRLLAAFLRAAGRRRDLHLTIVCPSWSRADLLDLARHEGFASAAFNVVTPSRLPFGLRVLDGCRRWWRRRSARRGRLGLIAAWARLQARLALEGVVGRVATARTAVGAAPWIVVLALAAAVLAAPLLIAGLVWILQRVGRRMARWFAGRSPVARARGFLARVLAAPARQPWVVRLFQTMMQRELAAMVRIADRQREVQAWFSPTAFRPEISRCRAPHLICVPDIVFTDAAVGFAMLDAGNHFVPTLAQIEATLRTGRAFTTYSTHVAETVLRERYGVPAERITVIPHAAADLDRLVTTHGFADNDAASRGYCRTLLRGALAKCTQQAYAAQFANTGVRFLFYASQFRPSKNVIGLLRVYERLLRKRYLGHKLLLTGDPNAIPEIAAFIAERRLQHDVLCLRGLSAAELAACYRLAELAVNPTFSEGGCPFTLTEALSVGTPVVMSRIPVTTEVVRDPALQALMLFDPRDMQAMEERIVWGLAHRRELLAAQLPLYRRLAERTWDRVVDEHVVALELAVGGQRAAS